MTPPQWASSVFSEFFRAGSCRALGGAMAVWRVTKNDGNVKLVYQCDGTVKQCGSGPEALEADLVAWVADSATPWDIIAIDGSAWFVRIGAAFASA